MDAIPSASSEWVYETGPWPVLDTTPTPELEAWMQKRSNLVHYEYAVTGEDN